MATSIIGPSLPDVAEHTRTRLSEIGFLFTSASFGYMLGSLGIGKLLDRLPGNAIMSSILLTMAGMLALIPLISELWLLTAILLILGIAEGGLDVSANLLLVWTYRQKSNPFLNALHFFFGVGAFLAPIVVAQSKLVTGSINWAFWALALYPLPVALWLLRLPGTRLPKTEDRIESQPYSWLLVLSIALVFVFYVGAEVGFGGWIYTYAISLELTDAVGAAYLTSLFWGSLTAGRLLGIAIATRFRPVIILLSDLIGCLLSLGLIWVLPHSKVAVWAGAIGLGLCMASIFPCLLAFAERRLTMSGAITRWFFVGTGVGGMLFPWLLGVLIESRGPFAIIPALFLLMTLALFAFLACKVLAEK